MQGRIHSFETFGSVDGPGVRFVVFLQGCPLRCRYCHNPDSWKINSGELMESDEVIRRALRYRSYWGSDGGITASGGEALMQLEFLTELFSKCHAQGINTCLDTAAGPYRDTVQYRVGFDALMTHTDLVMLDIKHIDANVHRDLTGMSNENILKCARHLADLGKDMWVRHVLVPGITDDEESLVKLGDFLRTLPNLKRFEILPYHSFGVYKWHELNIPYTLENTPSPKIASHILANPKAPSTKIPTLTSTENHMFCMARA